MIRTAHWLSRPQGRGAVGWNMSLKNPVTPPGIDPSTVQLVAQCLNHYATPGPSVFINSTLIRDISKQNQTITIKHQKPPCIMHQDVMNKSQHRKVS